MFNALLLSLATIDAVRGAALAISSHPLNTFAKPVTDTVGGVVGLPGSKNDKGKFGPHYVVDISTRDEPQPVHDDLGAIPGSKHDQGKWGPHYVVDTAKDKRGEPGLEIRQLDAQQALAQFHENYRTHTLGSLPQGTCTKDNIAIRKEWGNLSRQERLDYIKAIKCLQGKPSQTPRTVDKRARNRWDDYTVAHVLNTKDIHWSPLMLPWHRNFLHKLETELRDVCGYPGYIPWWDYTKNQDNLEENPLFDGSDTSLGGNGGSDGCLTNGPWKDYKMNIPNDITPNQCISRAFDTSALQRNLSPDSLAILLSYDDIQSFHKAFETSTGVHPNGHHSIGGIQDLILYSCQDTIFFSHHAAVDRLWAIWVGQDIKARGELLDNDSEFQERDIYNFGPMPEIDLNSALRLSPPWQDVTVGSMMNPTMGELCYMYD